MNRKTRNKILLLLIVLGLANFACYTLGYWYLQGDAPNGSFEDGEYFLRGHFIRYSGGEQSDAVSRAVWIYSYIHSITIWPTIAAVLVSMALLARPHIIATMESDSWMTGGTFVTVFITVVTLMTGVTTIFFIFDFIEALRAIAAGGSYGV